MSLDHGATRLDIVTTSPGGDQIALDLFPLERDVVAMSMDNGAMPGDRITGWLDTGTIYEIIEAKSQAIGVTWLDIALRSRGLIAMSGDIVTRWLDIVTSWKDCVAMSGDRVPV